MSVTSYKCPRCGSPLLYNSTTLKMDCAACGSSFDPESVKQMEEVLKNTVTDQNADWQHTADQEPVDGLYSYLCPSCGGEIMADSTTAAAFCPYCGNATIMNGSLSGAFKPDLIIPFKLDKNKALEMLKKHYKKKPLLSGKFKDENHLNEVKGFYVPFWLYSCSANGECKFDATKVRSWREGQYRVTQTDHFLIDRAGTVAFERIPADGSQKMSDAVMDAIEPFDYHEAIPFDPAYLSGFYADKYDVSAQDNAARVNTRVRNTVSDLLKETVSGYASVTSKSEQVEMSQSSVQYALLPVWLLFTEYKGKKYLFAMNGQTGKLVGDLPISKGRLFAWLFGLLASIDLLLCLLIGGASLL